MKKLSRICLVGFAAIMLPYISHAQIAETIGGLHEVLERLYDDMMPMCSQLIGVGQGLAGFAALWYIASRVWKHLANAEPIDFYPLFRPFAIGFCILIFPSVLGLINGVMKPTVTGTAAMVEGSNKAVERLLQQKEDALKNTISWKMYVGATGSGDRDKWYEHTFDESPSEEGWLAGIGNSFRFTIEKMDYRFRHSVKQWMSEILKILFEAAALCINTLRTFQLIVLAILGPLVFGLAVFDGFQHTLTVWLARYINIFLWLPVANIFGAIIGKIQEEMIKIDLQQIGNIGDTEFYYDQTEVGYLIFMIIGIVGYFTVPSVANYIVHAAGGGALQQKITGMFMSSTFGTAKGVAGGLGAGMAADQFGNQAGRMNQDMAEHGNSAPYFKGKIKGNS